MENIVDPIDGNWFSFELIQDGISYHVVIDSSNGATEDLITADQFARGFAFRLYGDYGQYGTLHAGTATIIAYFESNALESQIITLEEFTE